MKLTVIGSSSSGNCYILENDHESLLLECGLAFDKIKQGLKFNLRKVVGCLISHEHGDHCKGVHDVIKAGINIFASAGTIKAMGVSADHHRVHTVKRNEQFKVGGWTVLPFDVKHDAAEPFGYLLNHAETGKTLFLTDTFYCEYVFPGLNNILIEANYCQKIIDQKVLAGTYLQFLRDRNLKAHMSIDTCKKTLQAYDLTAVNNIVLIHLSSSNSDAISFHKQISELTGKSVHIAAPGYVIPNFNKQPF